MADATTTVGALKDAVGAFAAARQWEPFHSPKNLAMAVACEVGELLEPFRWLTAEESYAACQHPTTREAIADELADVVNLLLLFSLHSAIDISEALLAKLVKNAQKYPVAAGGSAAAETP
ncbi:MAG: nucleotide pyrophosphohydrolase [Gemmataceae bacterium]|nr:nucleotide pyrophosphohydrolase [Gemmataceae bacterium]MDW8266465.1 nucleotide pyrophosphohydrolase [Gemmataceae bacterium]